MQRNRTLENVRGHQSSDSAAEEDEGVLKPKRTGRSEITIAALPIDVLVRVAKYVPIGQGPSLERVSVRFRDAIYEAWRTLRRLRLDEGLIGSDNSFGRVDSAVINLLLEKLSRRALNIIDIGGFGWCSLNEHSIDLLTRFEKLERIEFGIQQVSVEALEKFLKLSASREKLKEVNARGSVTCMATYGEGPLMFEAFREQDGLAPLKLETLDLSRDHIFFDLWSFLDVVDVSRLSAFLVIEIHVNRSFFANFLNRATNLQQLAFSFDCYRDEEGDRHAREPGAWQSILQLHKLVIRAVGNLERLVSLRMKTSKESFYYCDCRNFNAEMTEMLKMLGRRGTLAELSLLPDLNDDDGAVLNSVAALPNLRSLDLCMGGDNATKEVVLKAQQSLVNLRVWGGDAYEEYRVVPHIMGSAQRLKSLHLYYQGTWFIPKEELLQIAALGQLEKLVVDAGDGDDNNVDDEVLAAWAEGFGSKLKSLMIPWCEKVTDGGLVAFIKEAPRLRELDVSKAEIADGFLKEVGMQCREMRRLDLSNCDLVTVEGVQAVVDGCPHLQKLHAAENFHHFSGKLKIGMYRKIFLVSTTIRDSLECQVIDYDQNDYDDEDEDV